MIELLTIAVTVGVSMLLLGVGYALGRQSARPHAAGGHHATVPLDELRPIKQPGRRMLPPNLDLIDTSGPGGREVKHRMEKRLAEEGRTPPPPCGGSGQATARDEWHDWGSSSPDLSYMPRSFIRRWREKNR